MIHQKKTRAKRSPIWKISKEDLINLLSISDTLSQVLAFFGLKNIGSNYKTLLDRLKFEVIDYTRFQKNKYINAGKIRQIDDKYLFIINCPHNRHVVKKRIIKENLLEYKCQICQCEPTWLTKKLVLVLDHINGINNDNRLENLRFLCPNCNSQTDNFAGKNKKYKKPTLLCKCGKLKKCKNSKECYDCVGITRRKVIRPTKEELEKLIWLKPTSTLAKELKVSDKAIEKWVKLYGLNKPPRGYWQKQKYQKNLS